MSSLFRIETASDEDTLQLLYDRLASRFAFGPARVILSRRKLTGGEIRYGRPHRITVSAHLTPREQEDTLRHEAAHAWAFQLRGARAGHGPLFRRLAEFLGAGTGPAPVTAALAAFRRERELVYRCEGDAVRIVALRAHRRRPGTGLGRR